MNTYVARAERWKLPKTRALVLALSVILGAARQVASAADLGGINTPPALVASIAPRSLAFGNQTINSTSAAQTLAPTNTNNAVLSIVGITDNARGSPQTVSSSGTDAAALVSLSPTSLAFGNRPPGTRSPAQTVTLRNTGNATLSFGSLVLTGTNASDFAQSNTCGSSLAAGALCTISVTFTPSVSGGEAASLSISDNASGSPQTVLLSGAGTHDVILSWTASKTPGVVGYNVYRGTTSGGPYTTKLNSSPVKGTTYTDEAVQAGKTYFYVVKAVASNHVTQSANSTQASATVPSP